VSLDDNIINGQLQVSSNNPAAQVAANNRIRGGVVGEQAPAAASRAGVAADRPVTADDRAAARKATAESAADAAGPAKL
jgi:hypothetical protein